MAGKTEARRAVFPGAREFIVESFSLDAPGPNEVLVENEASLVSPGTELAVYTGIHQGLAKPGAWPSFPFQPGYASAGRVIAVGPEVQELSKGDRIAFPCPHRSHTVWNLDRHWQHIPDDMDAGAGAFIYIMRFPFCSVIQAREWLGLSVAVQGLGLIGQLALRLYSQFGAHPVIGIDPVEARRDTALRGGATACVDPSGGDAPDQLTELLGGELASVCVDATGVAEAVVSASQLVHPGGQVIVVGSPRGTAKDVSMYDLVHGRSIHISGAHGSILEPRGKPDVGWKSERAINLLTHLVATGRVNPLELVMHEVSLDELGDAYEGMLADKNAYLATLIKWGG